MDFLGREVEVGDYIIFSRPGNALAIGKAVNITPKGVTMDSMYIVQSSNGTSHVREEKINRPSCKLFKLDKEYGEEAFKNFKKMTVKIRLNELNK